MWRRRVCGLGAALVALLCSAAPAHAELLTAAGPPEGFEETVALSGLTFPTAVRFAPDGRIFVAEKGGKVKVFDDFGDPTPTLYADLSRQVHDYWDRGLLGLALDPQFETRPYVYVAYTYNKDPNSPEMPRWPDSCPERIEDGCTVMNRLSRLHGGVEEVLIEDWCQQHPSHAIGSLAFGPDGALYVSGGDGASFNLADWGQEGVPPNPCNDPPGRYLSPPTAEGGALRSQDIRTPGDPTGLSGTILRLDPGSVSERRIVAYGLRNPFRIAVRPGTDEVWAGDVGWREWEEINRLPNPVGEVRNFGWPCYEGTGRQGAYDDADLTLCESLYAAGPSAVSPPHYRYAHHAPVTAGESCGVGSSSISGLAFTPQASSFPARYDGALFFADYSRRCIWAMLSGPDGVPDPARVELFADAAAVELQFGPSGDLYYVDLEGGTVRRIRSTATNSAPVARATATPSSGAVPLTVAFDASASSDPDDATLDFGWDLDDDGQFDDASGDHATFTYRAAGRYRARLRVRDGEGLTDTVNLPITAGTPPAVTIATPAQGATWAVQDAVALAGAATDSAGKPIPPGGLTWRINLRHCDRITGSCHTHPIESFAGPCGTFVAPDHEFPSYLELELTARDGDGLSTTVTRPLHPRTVELTLASDPPGARLTLGPETSQAPFTRDVIVGSFNGVGSAGSQDIGPNPFAFTAWSDGGARNHTAEITADTTLTASFTRTYRLAGTEVVGSFGSNSAAPGEAEVYQTLADDTGRATELWLYVTNSSTATDLVLGLYDDGGDRATRLLGSGRIENPQPDAWNKVDVDIPGVVAGHTYWIALLNPADGTGFLKWHALNGDGGTPEQESASGSLGSLPADWVPGRNWAGGPVSAYVVGTRGRAPLASPATAAATPRTRTAAAAVAGHACGAPVTPSPSDSSPSTPPPSTPSPSAPGGPVAEWGFDEPRGRTVKDSAGGNRGRISGAVRTRGRFGGGLSFDGRNDWVTVPDQPSLDLSRAMTLEAWVRPARRGARSVLVKERGKRLSYALYARPSAHVFTTAEHALRGPRALPLRRWAHLAMTWDGRVVRMYVDGRQVTSHALAGRAVRSRGPLRIGGNAIWPEFFKGDIDEVRVYDRALGTSEIVRDRQTRITPGAKRPRPKTSHRGAPRATKRAVHRGTRWLNGGGAAPRSG
jgi:glucose/arabinose dehydrogenase/PKD repeat protein